MTFNAVHFIKEEKLEDEKEIKEAGTKGGEGQ
jgi:hypothetical protein